MLSANQIGGWVDFFRKHKIVSGVGIFIVLLLVVAGIVGGPKKTGGNTAKGAELPVNKATTDPRWSGLADCLTANGIQNGATTGSLTTYAMTTPSGDAVGNITYSTAEQFKLGPISWTFAIDPAPPLADETAVTNCIHETFGPNGLSNKYVKKYASPTELADDAADNDPRWAALRTCLKNQGLSYFYESDFPDTLIVHGVGAVDYGTGGPGTLVGGAVKYLVNTNPPPSASARSEMDARVKAALRFVVG